MSGAPYRSDGPRKQVTAATLVRAYQKDTERQKMLIKKATLAQSRLLFLVNALHRLVGDEHFITLLRAQAIKDAPKPILYLVVASGYLNKLVANSEIVRFITQRYQEFLEEFRAITVASFLDQIALTAN